jgi:hypothetical protein
MSPEMNQPIFHKNELVFLTGFTSANIGFDQPTPRWVLATGRPGTGWNGDRPIPGQGDDSGRGGDVGVIQ